MSGKRPSVTVGPRSPPGHGPPALFSIFLLRGRLDDEHRARRVAHDGLRGRAEEDAPQSGAAVRRDDDQVAAALLGRADDLRGRVAVGDDLLDFEAGALLAAGYLRQLARRGVLHLLADVRDGERL